MAQLQPNELQNLIEALSRIAHIEAENARLTEALRVKEEEMEHLENTLNIRLNNHLCDMKPDFDDSIVGFNEAWEIVHATFKPLLAARRTQERGNDRPFPIQHGGFVPWWLAEIAYENYGCDQSLQRIAERGGFGVEEIVALIRGGYNS